MVATRVVICGDSIEWLKNRKTKIKGSVFIGIPDMSDININDVDEYYEYIEEILDLISERIKNNEFLVLIMTSRYYNGRFVDKAARSINRCSENSINLVSRKVIFNNYNYKDPAANSKFLEFSDLLIFRKKNTDLYLTKYMYNDIFYTKSKKLWSYGFHLDITDNIIILLKKNGVSHISDFFVGIGTTLAVAEKNGLDSFGIEIDQKLCDEAKKLVIK